MKPYTFSHLFKLAGKDADAFGTGTPSIYFDGRHAVAANGLATLSIDCTQPISAPYLIPVEDIKSAQLISPVLSIREMEDHLQINGVRVKMQTTEEVIPPPTREIIDLDKTQWNMIVSPFRLDGGRMGQLAAAMAEKDVRQYLNGMFLDFSSGDMVAIDGFRMHVISEAVPVVKLAENTLRGVVVPASIIKMMSSMDGVLQVFVMERGKNVELPNYIEAGGQKVSIEEGKEGVQPLATDRVICIGAGNAKFRIRALPVNTYPEHRTLIERNKNNPIRLLLDAEDTNAILSVARIATKSDLDRTVSLYGEGRTVCVSNGDRICKQLVLAYSVGEYFSIRVSGLSLSDAICAVKNFGTAVRLRCDRSEDEARGIYIGAYDFHSVVMAITEEEDISEMENATADAETSA